MPDKPGAGAAPQLAISLDPGSDLPLYRQIVDHVWVKVAEGVLDPGEKLPTVRQWAVDLGVHPNTVARAYKELELLGVVVRRAGEGTFVGLKPADRREIERHAELERLCLKVLSRAQALGFTADELLESLAELQSRGDSKSTRRSV
ncbi:MAG: GntR family transcriptional regulator [Gemmatimonadales bacterium]